jgi:hypothetical protein
MARRGRQVVVRHRCQVIAQHPGLDGAVSVHVQAPVDGTPGGMSFPFEGGWLDNVNASVAAQWPVGTWIEVTVRGPLQARQRREPPA